MSVLNLVTANVRKYIFKIICIYYCSETRLVEQERTMGDTHLRKIKADMRHYKKRTYSTQSVYTNMLN